MIGAALEIPDLATPRKHALASGAEQKVRVAKHTGATYSIDRFYSRHDTRSNRIGETA
jgi:hypothetical protein